MDRDSFERQERKQLRELARVAWDRELTGELTRLGKAFEKWKSGDLNPHALSDRIHQFHNGAARDLYGLYTRIHPAQLVARAVALGLLAERDLSASLRAKLTPSIEYYRADALPPLEDDEPTAEM